MGKWSKMNQSKSEASLKFWQVSSREKVYNFTSKNTHTRSSEWKLNNLNGAVEDAAKANTVFEEPVDLEDGVVRLLRSTVGHVVYV